MKLKKYLGFTIAVIVISSQVRAQTSSVGSLPDGTSVVQVSPEVKEESKKFSLDLGLEMAEKIVKDETTPKENTTSVIIAPSYRINDLLIVVGRIMISQDNYAQHETNASDAKLAVGVTGYQFNTHFKSTHSVATIIPASVKSTRDDRLKGNISLTNGISFTGDYITAAYKIELLRNFHEYTQNINGVANIEYRLSQIVELKIPITDQIAFVTGGVYKMARTYNNFERYAFGFDADVTYEFVKNLTANIGTSNDGSAVKSNGVDSNIALYDDTSSIIRAGLTYSY